VIQNHDVCLSESNYSCNYYSTEIYVHIFCYFQSKMRSCFLSRIISLLWWSEVAFASSITIVTNCSPILREKAYNTPPLCTAFLTHHCHRCFPSCLRPRSPLCAALLFKKFQFGSYYLCYGKLVLKNLFYNTFYVFWTTFIIEKSFQKVNSRKCYIYTGKFVSEIKSCFGKSGKLVPKDF